MFVRYYASGNGSQNNLQSILRWHWFYSNCDGKKNSNQKRVVISWWYPYECNCERRSKSTPKAPCFFFCVLFWFMSQLVIRNIQRKNYSQITSEWVFWVPTGTWYREPRGSNSINDIKWVTSYPVNIEHRTTSPRIELPIIELTPGGVKHGSIAWVDPLWFSSKVAVWRVPAEVCTFFACFSVG